MRRHAKQRGIALIMLLGIMATAAILAATLVLVLYNQMAATASDRSRKQSFYASEAALDSAVRLAKVNRIMSTTAEWLTPTELAAAFNGVFPAGATVTYRVYDDLATVNYNVKWDQGGPSSATTPDQRVWVEATVVYQGKTTRTRVLVQQVAKPFAEALPKTVTYSDTGITLNGHSDIYALDPTTGSPDTSGAPYQTAITAGGTWTTAMSSSWAEVGRVTTNSYADLAAPGTSTQSLGITTNGSVSLAGTVFNSAPSGTISASGHTFNSVTIQPGIVGYLSDYFDQAAQVSLQNEAMAGGTPASAPSSWTSGGFTTLSGTTLTTVTNTSTTTAFTAGVGVNYVTSGNLTINRNGTTARSLTFNRLYVNGDLTITGPARVTCTDLYVKGTLTINNTRTTAVTDNFGSALYCVGALSVSNNVETTAATLYGGDNITFTGYSSGIKTHRYPLVYANSETSTTTLSGNVQLYSQETTLNGDFTISGATNTAVKDWLGHLYVKARPTSGTGDSNWSGSASVTSRDYLNPTADPKPMWMGEYWSRTGTYNDEYGNVWIPGNSSTSVVFGSTGASTVLCPLMCTTEKTRFTGNITFGTRDKPVTFFYMCDNNGIYPQTFELGNDSTPYTGTYYGLLVINEAPIDIVDNNDSAPTVQGGVFGGCPYDPTYTTDLSMSDITLENYATIAYDQYVVGKIATSSLKTTVLVTETVPGSWQQLPLN